MNKKKPGRPKGKNKDTRLYILIPSKIKEDFKTITKNKGTNISVKTCELIIEYIEKNKNFLK